ncbi:MAG: hypothetical protein WA418_22650, partial [Bradyrhizobium sp.]
AVARPHVLHARLVDVLGHLGRKNHVIAFRTERTRQPSHPGRGRSHRMLHDSSFPPPVAMIIDELFVIKMARRSNFNDTGALPVFVGVCVQCNNNVRGIASYSQQTRRSCGGLTRLPGFAAAQRRRAAGEDGGACPASSFARLTPGGAVPLQVTTPPGYRAGAATRAQGRSSTTHRMRADAIHLEKLKARKKMSRRRVCVQRY